MSALGDQFRDAAKWLYVHPFSGCCTAIIETSRNGETLVFFTRLFRENKRDIWWRPTPRERLACLIALDLAALIADEDV